MFNMAVGKRTLIFRFHITDYFGDEGAEYRQTRAKSWFASALLPREIVVMTESSISPAAYPPKRLFPCAFSHCSSFLTSSNSPRPPLKEKVCVHRCPPNGRQQTKLRSRITGFPLRHWLKSGLANSTASSQGRIVHSGTQEGRDSIDLGLIRVMHDHR